MKNVSRCCKPIQLAAWNLPNLLDDSSPYVRDVDGSPNGCIGGKGYPLRTTFSGFASPHTVVWTRCVPNPTKRHKRVSFPSWYCWKLLQLSQGTSLRDCIKSFVRLCEKTKILSTIDHEKLVHVFLEDIFHHLLRKSRAFVSVNNVTLFSKSHASRVLEWRLSFIVYLNTH